MEVFVCVSKLKVYLYLSWDFTMTASNDCDYKAHAV